MLCFIRQDACYRVLFCPIETVNENNLLGGSLALPVLRDALGKKNRWSAWKPLTGTVISTLLQLTIILINAKDMMLNQEDGTKAWMSELSDGQQLVVWSFRRWLSGKQSWSMVWNEFAVRFGAEPARPILEAFVRLVDAIRSGARRVVHYHQPCCPCVGADEVLLTSLVGAAQAGRKDLVRAYALEMVQDPMADALVERALDLATVLSERGVEVPHQREWKSLSGEQPLAGAEQREKVTLH
jgi:hypothetical protein